MRGKDVTLPADLVAEEILHRLPSKDLLKFKAVCKEWRALISSHRFIQKHLERSKAEFRNHLTVEASPEIEILGYYANTLTSKKILGMGQASLLGSCDGLVLYFDKRIRALNPATGKTEANTRRPKPYTEHEILLQIFFSCVCSWFGRHPATDEYVLVLAFIKFAVKDTITFKVYSLSRDSVLSSLTEDLDGIYSFSFRDIGSFLHGRLHFTATNYNSPGDLETEIFAYDLEANKMLMMRAPLKHCPVLGVVDGCLCALNWNEVWVMKEYGVEESWAKYANLDHKFLIPTNGDLILRDDLLKAVGEGATELFEHEYGGRGSMRRRVVACIDSLVSPAAVWELGERRIV